MNATPRPRTAPLPIFPILHPRSLNSYLSIYPSRYKQLDTKLKLKPNNALPVWQQHIAYLPQAEPYRTRTAETSKNNTGHKDSTSIRSAPVTCQDA
jgi:hypothetical protein